MSNGLFSSAGISSAIDDALETPAGSASSLDRPSATAAGTADAATDAESPTGEAAAAVGGLSCQLDGK
jgi:hypothetical protein